MSNICIYNILIKHYYPLYCVLCRYLANMHCIRLIIFLAPFYCHLSISSSLYDCHYLSCLPFCLPCFTTSVLSPFPIRFSRYLMTLILFMDIVYVVSASFTVHLPFHCLIVSLPCHTYVIFNCHVYVTYITLYMYPTYLICLSCCFD